MGVHLYEVKPSWGPLHSLIVLTFSSLKLWWQSQIASSLNLTFHAISTIWFHTKFKSIIAHFSSI
jgi:hypothetical protein